MSSKTVNSEQSDNVIRNPMRNAPRQIPSFEPEYQRLGINPIDRGNEHVSDDVPFIGIDDTVYDHNSNQITLDPNAEMIDNNDYIFDTHSYMPPQMASQKNPSKRTPPPLPSMAEPETSKPTPQIGDYLLMVNGKLILSSSIGDVQQKVKDILYKEDEEFSGQNISIDDIVVLKRIDIKVGVFIGE
jgi:hypothetical protein